jgi:ABC-type antimicrobial peptide transport system permease subunit
MIKNYLRIALRNLSRNKIYSTLNIAGLALGMAVALLIGLWVADEFNANKNFGHYDKIVQLLQNGAQDGRKYTDHAVPIPLVNKLRKDYSDDFESVTMMSETGGHMLGFKDHNFGTEGCRYAEPGIIDLLPMKMISGGPNSLEGPASVIIDQSLAKNLFGNEDPLNKIIRVDNQKTMRVTGVYQNFPQGSAFGPGTVFQQIHLIMSWDQYAVDFPGIKSSEGNWNDNPFIAYARLTDKADIDRVSARIRPLMNGHGRTDHPEVVLYPMSKWHLYNFKDGHLEEGAIKLVRMFGFIGLFVLLLACVNFMNMSTARSERRSREVGIRKAVGSLRVQLIIQFLGESMLLCCFALALALAIVQVSLPAFNNIANKSMEIPWTSATIWLVLAAFTLITGFIAGSYPAFYLSSFNAVSVLKGALRPGRFASLPRKILVVLQFTVSIALIIGTLVVSDEIQFARNRPMGYAYHGVIGVFRSTPQLMQNYDVIRNELMNNGSVSDVALSSSPTSMVFGGIGGLIWPGKDPAFDDNFGSVRVSRNFGHTIGWEIIQGRDFSKDLSSDSTALILNETAVKYMGLSHPIGTIVRSKNDNNSEVQFHIIGVIRDMMMQSPFENVIPTIFSMNAPAPQLGIITIKLNPSMPMATALARVQPVFKRYNPASSFDFWDNEQRFGWNFILEDRIGSLTRIFAVMAILISCLGMFGLSSFTAERRTREIGLRKVLGATVPHVWGLLIREFLLLVGLAFLIALPLSYAFMHHWLQQYAYRVPISAWMFIITLAGTLFLTLLTVSFQSIRASRANPVKSLRSE